MYTLFFYDSCEGHATASSNTEIDQQEAVTSPKGAGKLVE